MKLIFATQNANKAAEISKLLPAEIEVVTLLDLNYTEELEETQDTLEGNALQKAKFVFKKFGLPCFADDTGLEIRAINNEPGVLSARYAGPERDNNKNMDLVLEKLSLEKDRSAQFRTVIAYVDKDKEIIFEGIVEGEITTIKKGKDGFGYDPIFLPKDSNKTFAEMSLFEKNKISHRSRAVKKFIEHFI